MKLTETEVVFRGFSCFDSTIACGLAMDLRINESMMEPTGAENKKAQRKLQNLDWRDVIHDSIT